MSAALSVCVESSIVMITLPSVTLSAKVTVKARETQAADKETF